MNSIRAGDSVRRGQRLLWLGLCLVSVGTVLSAESLATGRTVSSAHFVVHDTRRLGPSFVAMADAERKDPRRVQFDADSLLFTADRVRESIVKEMRLPATRGHPTQCHLHPAARNDETIVLVSERYLDGWVYRVNVPDAVEGLTAVRAFTQLTLLQYANQGAPRSAELPTWLVEGLTLWLLSDTRGATFLNKTSWASAPRLSARLVVGQDRLAPVRAYLRANPALSFTDLSGTPPGDEAGFLRYQMSAQLLVAQILQAPDGRDRMAAMLRALPHCWNWQTAFLDAFGFERLLAVEKWWSVTVAAFVGNDASVVASSEQTLARLGEILTVATDLRSQANDLPSRETLGISRLIAESDYTAHRSVIEQRLPLLTTLRRTAPPRLATVIDGYQECLQDYLRQRNRAPGRDDARRQPVLPAALVVRQTLRRLADLEAQLGQIRKEMADATLRAASGNDPASQRP